MCGRVIQSSGALLYAIVEGMDVRDARAHNYPVRTENFILIEGASESPRIRGDACAGSDDTDCIGPAVQQGAAGLSRWECLRAGLGALAAVRAKCA